MKKQRLIAFTLAEILITLGIIGVVAALTIPTLLQNNQETQMVSGLLKFHSTLQQAILMWKQETSCYESAYRCMLAQDNGAATYYTDFVNRIGKYMQLREQHNVGGADFSYSWLPDDTANYYGTYSGAAVTGGKVANHCTGTNGIFILADGTTFAMRSENATSFEIWVDVNGKKPPNRIGKDTFRMLVGGVSWSTDTQKKDINYCWIYGSGNNLNGLGLCACGGTCNPNETNPTGDAAMPTSYVLFNKRLPDFKALSGTVGGFKP